MWAVSRNALDQTLEYIRDVDRAESPAEVCATLLRASKSYGVEHILAGTIHPPTAIQNQLEANAILIEWPAEWLERYLSKGYLFVDPTVRRLMSDSRPFLWSELDPGWQDDPAANQLMNEASDFGLKRGITVPLVTLDGMAGFSLSGEKVDIPPDRREMIALLGSYAVMHSLRPRILSRLGGPVLSQRERDALQWAAEGKTEWEIGTILGVSEHTAEKFLRIARAKLGAANRTHAVAEAIRRGLIS